MAVREIQKQPIAINKIQSPITQHQRGNYSESITAKHCLASNSVQCFIKNLHSANLLSKLTWGFLSKCTCLEFVTMRFLDAGLWTAKKAEEQAETVL